MFTSLLSSRLEVAEDQRQPSFQGKRPSTLRRYQFLSFLAFIIQTYGHNHNCVLSKNTNMSNMKKPENKKKPKPLNLVLANGEGISNPIPE